MTDLVRCKINGDGELVVAISGELWDLLKAAERDGHLTSYGDGQVLNFELGKIAAADIATTDDPCIPPRRLSRDE